MHQKSKRKIKSQCLKSIFKEKNENHKSKVDLRTSRTIGGTDLHETGTGRTQTGRSSYQSPYISFHAFTWDRRKNELRPVSLHLSRWPDTSYFRTGLRPCSSHVKQKNQSQTGSINSLFLRMAPPFLLFLSKNRNTATNNICKQDLEVASMLGLMWGIGPFWDAVK